MNDIQKKVLIVLGMHRSGTSLLAGCLHLLGVNLGKVLMPPNKSNESGYFENHDIMLIHDILLRDIGCRWDMIGNFPDGWFDSEAALQAEKRLMSLIEREMPDDRLWAVKDPRMCRLMPLWQRILNRLEIQPLFIIMVRHPFEAAKSLEKRDQFDLMKGHLLWMVHYRDALNTCLEYSHVMVTYDQLLANPLTTLQRIFRVLQVSFPKDIQSQFSSIIDFVKPELNHHQSSHDPKTGVFSQYDWVYQQLAQIQTILNQPKKNMDANASNFKGLSSFGVQLSVFPLVAAVPVPSDFKFEHNHATAMLNNLLGIIGRYEREYISDSIRRERALLIADQSEGGLLFAQVYFPASWESDKRYSEENSQKILLVPEEWEKISVVIPRREQLKSGSLRFDPLNRMGMAVISSIGILNAETGRVLWSADSFEAFKQCSLKGDAFSFSMQDSLNLVCTGSDSQLFLPEIPNLPDCPLLLQVWIKVSRNLTFLQKICNDVALKDFDKTKEIEALNGELSRYRDEINSTGEQLAVLRQQNARVERESAELRMNLERKLHSQESLTREYYTELKKAETQQSVKDDQIKKIKRDWNCEVQGFSQKLERIQELQEQEKEKQRLDQAYYLNIIQLSKWLRQIENDYFALKNSFRWKTGNILIRFFELLSFRGKQPMATDHLEQLFQERRSWIPRLGYGKQDQDLLTAWMRQAKNDLDALVNSRRWRIGHGIVSILERLLIRGEHPLAIDHMQSVIDEYVRWVNSITVSSKTIYYEKP